jgi:hypothetical protein
MNSKTIIIALACFVLMNGVFCEEEFLIKSVNHVHGNHLADTAAPAPAPATASTPAAVNDALIKSCQTKCADSSKACLAVPRCKTLNDAFVGCLNTNKGDADFQGKVKTCATTFTSSTKGSTDTNAFPEITVANCFNPCLASATNMMFSALLALMTVFFIFFN